MMEKQNRKAWLYLLPALLFLLIFMVYPLIDVLVYSFEEGYNSASQTFMGVGSYNYSYVLHDPYFLQALKNTFLLVIITVPVSTGLALLISTCLISIKRLRELFQTIYFLPYVTNTLAVGLVFMILFKKTAVHARGIQVRPKECHRVGVGFKSADKAGDNQVKDHRGDHRQCDAVKDAPAPGAIHARGIVIILVHRGECAG